MTDIVKRLRKLDATASGVPIFADAADEIERLRAMLGAIIDSDDIVCVRTDDHDCPLHRARWVANWNTETRRPESNS